MFTLFTYLNYTGALTFLSGILTFPVRRREYGEVP